MPDTDTILYSIAAFICALFVLEYGADKFIDHTAIIAKRTGIPQALIALFTAGAEWEELAVVIFCVVRGRQSLALGNVVGSAISNILGAFSLGLLFYRSHDEGTIFDKSAVRYTIAQMVVVVLAAVLLSFRGYLQLRVLGGVLVAAFLVYVGTIFWAITRGSLAAPEGSDSESDSERDSDGGSVGEEEYVDRPILGSRSYGTTNARDPHTIAGDDITSQHSSPLDCGNVQPRQSSTTRHGLLYHLSCLVLGFLALTISAYVLSHAATTLTDSLGISDAAFGIVVLSLATTLPEKLVATVSGIRGHAGIMVANTVGSNIFLLTLCLGVIWLSEDDTDSSHGSGGITGLELGIMVASAATMSLAVLLRRSLLRYLGCAYGGFIAVELVLKGRS
ncbi:hypothetical protein LTR86_000346 [Recurvomyces mirabilis]|nr:hypothetical protein LTR86_000346 [Recurvomyces mirabilis]